MQQTKLKNIVAFCALMQNGGGVIDKSPDYIQEKFERYCLSEEDETEWGLDSIRTDIVKRWIAKWIK